MVNYFTFNSLLAKIIFVVLAIIATNYHIIAGVIVVLIFISLSQNVIEGMESNDVDNSSKLSNSVKTFKSTNCVNGKLMKDNKTVTPQDVHDNFPNVTFPNDTCNPCDDDCKFEIISSHEQLNTEENLRATDSNQFDIQREKAIKQE
jgi:hypothetical protein